MFLDFGQVKKSCLVVEQEEVELWYGNVSSRCDRKCKEAGLARSHTTRLDGGVLSIWASFGFCLCGKEVDESTITFSNSHLSTFLIAPQNKAVLEGTLLSVRVDDTE